MGTRNGEHVVHSDLVAEADAWVAAAAPPDADLRSPLTERPW